MNAIVNDKDEIIMGLVHYFVTEEDYTPINVVGVNNEIWLENLDAPYKIIRINSKYIHNNEQYNVDLAKIKFILKQIKKKTLSFKMNVLNICLDLGNAVELNNKDKIINTINITKINDIKKIKSVKDVYPKIKNSKFKDTKNIDELLDMTVDINKKTESDYLKHADVFKNKKIVVTKALILFNILLYIVTLFYTKDFTTSLILLGANSRDFILNGEYYRLLTCAFLHGSIFHLLVNMYSLWIIGSQLETFIGKGKFLIVYLLSAFMGSLFSVVISANTISIGASGAIFGLMGSLLYFGYHYRLYLTNSGTLTNQIIPIIVVNLLLGFVMTGIDNAAHIGGLIGGYLATMIVGLKFKSTKMDTINGLIVYTVLVVFLFYVLFKVV